VSQSAERSSLPLPHRPRCQQHPSRAGRPSAFWPGRYTGDTARRACPGSWAARGVGFPLVCAGGYDAGWEGCASRAGAASVCGLQASSGRRQLTPARRCSLLQPKFTRLGVSHADAGHAAPRSSGRQSCQGAQRGHPISCASSASHPEVARTCLTVDRSSQKADKFGKQVWVVDARDKVRPRTSLQCWVCQAYRDPVCFAFLLFRLRSRDRFSGGFQQILHECSLVTQPTRVCSQPQPASY
jgi:hypothetical protein